MPIKVLNEFLPNAEETRLGAIKVGDTLEIDQEEGVLNVDPTSVIGLYYSNCITEIAQDVKLEIVGDNFVLKTGSRVYIPAGNNNTFSLYTAEEDLTINGASLNGRFFLCFYTDGSNIAVRPESIDSKSGNTFPENPTNATKFYKSDENLMYRYDGDREVWKPVDISIPLAIVTFTNGVAEDIIQVFNGVSYFGHHVFILPDLKGVAPDGITERGYVKSVNIEVDDIKVYDLTSGSVTNFNNSFLFINPLLEVACQSYNTVDRAKELVRVTDLIQYSYNENRDYAWTGTAYINPINLPVVECSLKDSSVIYFRILQPLRIATVSDVKESTDSFLFDYKWADHIPNKLSWLRADTFSWQDGNIYKAAYDHLLKDMQGKSPSDSISETIGGVTIDYYVASDGHKIVTSDQESNVEAIYQAVGVAWYYVFDHPLYPNGSKRFKLPRTKFGFTGIRDGVGRYVAPGLPDPDVDVIYRQDSTSSGVYRDQFGTDGWTGSAYSNTGGTDEWMQSSKDKGSQRPLAAIFTNSIYGASSTVQPPATQMYLYCYVGRADQDTLEKSEIDIAAITNNSINQIISTKNTSLTEINITTEEGINRLNTDSNALNRTQITNCITEIPQDLKLEISNDGSMVLKAGSKVYVPNGFEQDGTTPHFDVTVTTSDLNCRYGSNTPYLIYTANNNTKLGQNAANNIYSGDTAPTTSNWYVWYDTANNRICRYNNSGVMQEDLCSLPVAIGNTDSEKYTSIAQVFNGFGYVGSTAFVLPGVKGLIPNGRNADGTLNNIELNVTRVLMHTFTYTGPVEFRVRNSVSDSLPNYWFYDEVNNRIKHNSTITDTIVFATGYEANGTISSFVPKITFNAINYCDADYVVCYQKPNSNNNYTWYRLYKSGWVEQGGITA